jgi:hypothetical protein
VTSIISEVPLAPPLDVPADPDAPLPPEPDAPPAAEAPALDVPPTPDAPLDPDPPPAPDTPLDPAPPPTPAAPPDADAPPPPAPAVADEPAAPAFALVPPLPPLPPTPDAPLLPDAPAELPAAPAVDDVPPCAEVPAAPEAPPVDDEAGGALPSLLLLQPSDARTNGQSDETKKRRTRMTDLRGWDEVTAADEDERRRRRVTLLSRSGRQIERGRRRLPHQIATHHSRSRRREDEKSYEKLAAIARMASRDEGGTVDALLLRNQGEDAMLQWIFGLFAIAVVAAYFGSAITAVVLAKLLVIGFALMAAATLATGIAAERQLSHHTPHTV